MPPKLYEEIEEFPDADMLDNFDSIFNMEDWLPEDGYGEEE